MKIKEILTELIGIKNKIKDLPKNPNPDAWKTGFPLGVEWHEILLKNGFYSMGSGGFGTVWEHPKLSYVLKVFRSDDVGYTSWVNIAIKNKNNPHMPRFISSRIFHITPEVSTIRMEKLSPVTNKDDIDAITGSFYLLCRRPNEFPSELVINPRWKNIVDRGDWIENHPEWLNALDITKLAINSGNNKFEPDFGGSNIMTRLDGTLVITDPIFDKSSLMREL